ncbi:MAG: ABC transporter substrate-binding protein, partial [Intestinibacter sp.]|uniref:ABC transporter substrate-binding protein n=1 Tax=Intestinibacter sp. TaxID=1965304 RepID=UPI003F15AFAD
MKKRLLTLLLGIVMMFSVVGCSQSQSSESSKSEEKSTVTIKSLNGNKEEIDLEVPYDPQRIAVLDFAALDILDNLGVGDRVVGSADTSIDYLSSYSDNDKITNLGTIKEADLEAVMECEPDVRFIGGRLAGSYDKLSEIA